MTDFIMQIVGISLTLFSAVAWLSSRLEKLGGKIEAQGALLSERIRGLDKDLTQLQTQIDETRKGRVELWSEVNGLRERVGVVETKVEGVQNACST